MTVVDVATGEVVDRRPVLATPGSPITAQQIAAQCRSVEVWAEHCDSIDELREADARLSAIGQYLARTSTDGRNSVATARLRLETRIGVLLGEAKTGRPETSSTSDIPDELSRNQRHQFRKLADHPEIVEAVIDDSDDEDPASRRKVLDEINRAKQAPAPEPGPEELRLQELAAVAKSIVKAHEFFTVWKPEDIHELNDPTTVESVRLLMGVIAPWWETYKATKPAGLTVHQGGKQ